MEGAYARLNDPGDPSSSAATSSSSIAGGEERRPLLLQRLCLSAAAVGGGAALLLVFLGSGGGGGGGGGSSGPAARPLAAGAGSSDGPSKLSEKGDSHRHRRRADEACLNPVVSTGSFWTDPLAVAEVWEEELRGWELAQVTDMQRHGDRWLYRHDNVGNVCWPGQLNSSLPELAEQCGFQLDSLWQTFPRAPDPYSSPDKGNCDLMQITLSGLRNSRNLGKTLAAEYGKGGRHPLRGLASTGCVPGSVFLASDSVEKNERTIAEVYTGLCGWAPLLEEFPASRVLVNASTTEPGSPFWLRPGLCAGHALEALNREASEALSRSRRWRREAQELASIASILNGHELPKSPAEYRPFLSALIDCAVCHACLHLEDTPKKLLNDRGLPDERGLFGRLDRAETAGVLWPLEYFRSRSEEDFLRYARLEYGYYFAVLADRMQTAVDTIRSGGTKIAPEIFIQVMSDTNISPQLYLMGLYEEAAVRPQWLATLITELWVQGTGKDAAFAVRVLYNGRVQMPCAGQRGSLCPWPAFRELIGRFAPSRDECPAFYDNYQLISSFHP